MTKISWLSELINYGKLIESEYAKLKGNTSLNEFAYQKLSEKNWGQDFILEDFVQDFFALKNKPEQFKVHSTFGEPPFTIFNSIEEDLIVEIYLWETYHTSIHDHGFDGAFQVLQGRSIECTYDFQNIQDINNDCQSGDLQPIDLLLLEAGATRKILPGPQYIHRVLHIQPSTVTLIIRSKNKKPDFIQRNYYFKKFSSPCFPNDDIVLQLRTFDWMLSKNIMPKQDFIKPLMYYERFWNLMLSSDSQVKNKLMKLVQLVFHEYALGDIFADKQLLTLLKQIPDERDKILLVSLEFLGIKKWPQWTEANLNIQFDKANSYLANALKQTHEFKQHQLSGIQFLKDLNL